MTKGILRSLLTDVKRLLPWTSGLGRDLYTLEARLEHEGVAFLATTLANLDEAVLNGLTYGRFVCPVGLNKARGKAIPTLLSGMLSHVFDDVTGDRLEGLTNVEVLSLLRQVLTFLEEASSSRYKSSQALISALDEIRQYAKHCGDVFVHNRTS